MSTGPSPIAGRVLPAATWAANDGKLWIAVATVLAVTGAKRGRRAAIDGLAAVGISSFVNALAKRVVGRPRPRGPAAVGMRRVGRAPRTSSFPSGHMASATAFTVAAGSQLPLAVPGLIVATGAVGWSRMHAGRHFPSDVIAGTMVGVAVGVGVRTVGQRIRRGQPAPGSVIEEDPRDGDDDVLARAGV
ncbi:MAG: phosphatase PAP2 family protein [Acidimicrobiales bacterium]